MPSVCVVVSVVDVGWFFALLDVSESPYHAEVAAQDHQEPADRTPGRYTTQSLGGTLHYCFAVLMLAFGCGARAEWGQTLLTGRTEAAGVHQIHSYILLYINIIIVYQMFLSIKIYQICNQRNRGKNYFLLFFKV